MKFQGFIPFLGKTTTGHSGDEGSCLGPMETKSFVMLLEKRSFLQSPVVHLGRNLIYLNFGRVKSMALYK